MVTSKSILVTLGVALALGACGPKAPKPNAAASAVEAESAGPLPSDVPLYPRAQITGVYGTPAAPQVLAVSGDAADRIAAYYGREMQTRGWKQDRSWYARPDLLIFKKGRRSASLNLRDGAPMGAKTMLAVNVSEISDVSK